MAHAKGEKRDFAGLEKRRMQGGQMLLRGIAPAKAAKATGASIQSVCDWARKMREGGGLEALRHPGRAGRKRRLKPGDLERVLKAVAKGTAAWGFERGRWTMPRLAAVIERVTGVRYHPSHVWRMIMKKR